MKFTKLATLAAGITLLAASLAPMSVSALSTASITMEGVYSNNGHFSVLVYEDTGSDTVTGASLALTFDKPVANVSYDYSVGPFVATTPSGAHNAYGTVTGKNPLARVSFTLASPGTVIADVSESSYLKHAGEATIESFVLNLGEAHFTYEAPAPQAAPAQTNSTKKTVAAAQATAPAVAATPAEEQEQPAVASESTEKPTAKSDTALSVSAKHDDGIKGTTWALLAALVILAGLVIYRNKSRKPVAAPAAAKSTAKKKTSKR